MAERIQLWPPTKLVPYARNARTHSPAQVAKVARSIVEFGFTNPILVDGDAGIIAGHARLAAALSLGLKKVPVIELTHLSEAQKRAYIIADNRLALDAGWDDDLLAEELRALNDDGFKLELMGFSDAELLELLEPNGATDDDFDTMPSGPPVTKAGDVWLLGSHRVMCGDATVAGDVAMLLAGARPHLMVTDPPYGIDYHPEWRAEVGVNKNHKKMGKVENDARADWREAWSLFPGEITYVWHSGCFASLVQESLESMGFEIRAQIIWSKDRFALSRGDYHWQHEACWYAVRAGKAGRWAGGRSQSTVWQIPARDDSGHSTQKPVECMRRPVLNNSKAGDSVYDPFLGSGTMVVACDTCGRQCLAMEIDPTYVDVAVRRWQALTNLEASLELDRRTFAVVAAERVGAQV
jgi:DNA modification methylase